MTPPAPYLFGRRELVLGSTAIAVAPMGCDDSDPSPGELWASAQGADPGSFELVVAGSQGVYARIVSDVRGHGLAVSPTDPARVVMFGRRPQTVGVVGNILSSEVVGRFECARGRHLVGHGCFSLDGTRLFVAEADLVTGEGTIAVLDAGTLQRIDEFVSGGVGPHEVVLMPGGSSLAVANGGLVTEPGGRDPINLDSMRSSLVYLDADTGALLGEHTVAEPKASLRHLAVSRDGTLVVVMQIQRAALGDVQPRPLVAIHRPGGVLESLQDGLELGTAMDDYAGAVAVDDSSRVVAVTSPRGNLVAFWDLDTGASLGVQRFDDVSGVAVSRDGTRFVLTGSGGQLRQTETATLEELPGARARLDDVQWDNHLLTLRT
ncbi:MAG: DUF1513 domain-containing protein [Nannocystaceae bacterium]|nr:DUF1513 domain-containing protein [Nannocystaceae bacterium]